jgi:hypothetical protein
MVLEGGEGMLFPTLGGEEKASPIRSEGKNTSNEGSMCYHLLGRGEETSGELQWG